MKRFLLSAVLTLPLFLSSTAQQHIRPEAIQDKMQWFADAKLGIFIH